MEATNTQLRVDARVSGCTHVLRAGAAGVHADAAGLVATDVVAAAQHIAAWDDTRRALEATVVRTDLARGTGCTHRPTTALRRNLRDARPCNRAAAIVGRTTPHELRRQHDQSSRHKRPQIQDRTPSDCQLFPIVYYRTRPKGNKIRLTPGSRPPAVRCRRIDAPSRCLYAPSVDWSG